MAGKWIKSCNPFNCCCFLCYCLAVKTWWQVLFHPLLLARLQACLGCCRQDVMLRPKGVSSGRGWRPRNSTTGEDVAYDWPRGVLLYYPSYLPLAPLWWLRERWTHPCTCPAAQDAEVQPNQRGWGCFCTPRSLTLAFHQLASTARAPQHLSGPMELYGEEPHAPATVSSGAPSWWARKGKGQAARGSCCWAGMARKKSGAAGMWLRLTRTIWARRESAAVGGHVLASFPLGAMN